MSETPASAVEKDRIERAMRSTSLAVSDLQVQAVVAEVESIVRERLNTEKHTAENDATVVHLADGLTWQEAAEATRVLTELARVTGRGVVVSSRVFPPGSTGEGDRRERPSLVQRRSRPARTRPGSRAVAGRPERGRDVTCPAPPGQDDG